MFSYYPVRDTQAQSCSLTHLLGGEEGVKQVPQIFFSNPGAIIGKGSPNNIPYPFCSNSESASPVRFNHKMLGIDDDVDKDLLQLKTVCHDFRQVRGKVSIDLDVVYLLFIGTPLQCLLYNAVYIYRFLC